MRFCSVPTSEARPQRRSTEACGEDSKTPTCPDRRPVGQAAMVSVSHVGQHHQPQGKNGAAKTRRAMRSARDCGLLGTTGALARLIEERRGFTAKPMETKQTKLNARTVNASGVTSLPGATHDRVATRRIRSATPRLASYLPVVDKPLLDVLTWTALATAASVYTPMNLPGGPASASTPDVTMYSLVMVLSLQCLGCEGWPGHPEPVHGGPASCPESSSRRCRGPP